MLFRIFFIAIIASSNIQRYFQEREFTLVIRHRNEASSRTDSLYVLLSILKTRNYHFLFDFLPGNRLPGNELLLTCTRILENIPSPDINVLELLKRLRKEYPEIEDFLTFRYIDLLVERGLIDSAASEVLRFQNRNSPYFKKSLEIVLPAIVQHGEYELLKTFLDMGIEELPVILWAKGKYFYNLKRRKKASIYFIKLLKKYPESYFALDACKYVKGHYGEKGNVYFSHGNYKKAYYYFRKTTEKKFLYRRLISIYRTGNYRGFFKEYKMFKRRLSHRTRKKLNLYLGYAYWKTGDYRKALKYFVYLANEGNEKSAREVLDLLIKEKVVSFEEFVSNHHIRSPELAYTAGLYALYIGEKEIAKKFLKEALKSDLMGIKLRSLFFLHRMGERNLDIDLEDSYYFDLFSLYVRGIPVDTSGEYLNSLLTKSISPDSLARYRALLLYGNYQDALKYVPRKPEYYFRAILIADSLAYDNLVIMLGLKLLNTLQNKNPFPLYLLQKIYPTSYLKKIQRTGKIFNLDPLLVLSLVREESWFNTEAVSPKGAIGLMQLLPVTAEKILNRPVGVEDLHSPDINLYSGCLYLKNLIDSLDNIILALAGYNAGPHRAIFWKNTYKTEDPFLLMELIPFYETRRYVERIMRNIIIYKYLTTKSRRQK